MPRFSPAKVKEAGHGIPGVFFRRSTPKKSAVDSDEGIEEGRKCPSSPESSISLTDESLDSIRLPTAAPQPLSDRARGVLEAITAVGSLAGSYRPSRLKAISDSRRLSQGHGKHVFRLCVDGASADDEEVHRRHRREVAAHYLTRWPTAPEDSFSDNPCALSKLDPAGTSVAAAVLTSYPDPGTSLPRVFNDSSGSPYQSLSGSPFPSPRIDRPLWLPPPTPHDGLKPSKSYAIKDGITKGHMRMQEHDRANQQHAPIAMTRSMLETSPRSQTCEIGRPRYGHGLGINVQDGLASSSAKYPQEEIERPSTTSNYEHGRRMRGDLSRLAAEGDESWSYTLSNTQSAPGMLYNVGRHLVGGASSPQNHGTLVPIGDISIGEGNLPSHFVAPIELEDPEVRVEIKAAGDGPVHRALRLDWNVVVRIGQGEKIVRGQTVLQGTLWKETTPQSIKHTRNSHKGPSAGQPRTAFLPRPLLLPSVSSQGSLSSTACRPRSTSVSSCRTLRVTNPGLPQHSASPDLGSFDCSSADAAWPEESSKRLSSHRSVKFTTIASARVEARREGRPTRPYLSGGFGAVRVVHPVPAKYAKVSSVARAVPINTARVGRAKVSYDVNRRPGQF